MKTFKNIVITIIAAVWAIALIFSTITGLNDPFKGTKFIGFLNGIGNLFLMTVLGVIGMLMLSLPIILPFMIYKGLKNSDEDKDTLKQFGLIFAILIGAVSFLAIAGSLLRELH